MDYQSTEEQQIATLKKWWKDNGNSLLIGIGLALAIIFGWKAYQNQQMNKRYEASSVYQQLLEASFSAMDPAEKEKSDATIRLLGKKLKTDFEGSGYAHLAALVLAKTYVESKQLDNAEAELNWLLAQGNAEADLKALAQGRLARVLAARQKYEDALNLVSSTENAAYRATYLEIKGDILFAMGKKSEAEEAYQSSKAELSGNTARVLLEMKLTNLAEEEGI
ncbi:MAG: hypothetical protein CSA50_00945 [Gammaproteobacteria bacterium]|nr:MAG: hypothetical protein CSA50_00945 [Gammaproteobacteria bacterium]